MYNQNKINSLSLSENKENNTEVNMSKTDRDLLIKGFFEGMNITVSTACMNDTNDLVLAIIKIIQEFQSMNNGNTDIKKNIDIKDIIKALKQFSTILNNKFPHTAHECHET